MSEQKSLINRFVIVVIEAPPLERHQIRGTDMTIWDLPPCNCSDDRIAIMSVIARAAAGDTILFRPGTFKISNGAVRLKSGITYTSTLINGQIAAKIVGQSSRVRTLVTVIGPASNITISNLYFSTLGDGSSAGLQLIGHNAADTTNITVTNCIFDNAAINALALQSSHITHNTFLNINNNNSRPAALGGGWLNNSTISYNAFRNNWQDISFSFGHGASNKVSGQNNVFSYNWGMGGTHRMGMEIQDTQQFGSCANMIIDHNWWGGGWNNDLDGNPPSNSNSAAYSIVCDGGISTTFSNNYADGLTADGRLLAGMGAENSGAGTEASKGQITGNDVRHFQYGLICYGPGAQNYVDNNVVSTHGTIGNPFNQSCPASGTTTNDSTAPPHPPAAGASDLYTGEGASKAEAASKDASIPSQVLKRTRR